jgi:hypothetical protein
MESFFDPAYVAATPGVQTWSDPLTGTTRAVPWDPFLQSRFQAFAKALGDHMLPNASAGGAMTAFRDHPVLANLMLGIPGMTELRDMSGAHIESQSGYTRSGFASAVVAALGASASQFPAKAHFVGLWKIEDSTTSPELWQYVGDQIIAQLGAGRIGLWQENLAASKDSSGVVTGYPSTAFAVPEAHYMGSTFISFQALEGWLVPFTDPSKVAGATPADGINYGTTTFGAQYFELYVGDLVDPAYRPGLESWAAILGR